MSESSASQCPIDAYVSALGGSRSIRKILVANNGIAAVKAIRSIRRWAYETFGDERLIVFVAMATPEDVAANAEYVRMADVWTSVPGGSNNRNFANVALIADLASRFSCDAVWAGWGHASENPALPAALQAIGVTFLGPPPESMHALGDKIASSIIAQSAGVPTVSWSGSGLTVNYVEDGGVPSEIYKKACVTDSEHARRVAKQCGYPIVVKASEGGGGKGIRIVHDEHGIASAYRQVAGEVPGSPIFLMRLVENSRHLEVQIVADEYGDAIAFYGRDCSVQRRHQKIIEEGPVVAAPSHVWKRLEQAAVALAKEVGYVGAGTVEYLYKGDTSEGEFYFLELNPRLQVEHPVTEWITGVNLPALQLHVGMGIPLRKVSSVRKFLGLSDTSYEIFNGSPAIPPPSIASPARSFLPSPTPEFPGDTLEPLALSPVPPQGHVIACRVTAENPDEGFQPTSGAIQELTFRNTPNVWGYFSVGASGGVHEFSDSQFGHLFAWGENREASRRCLVLALKELSIRGDIRTTVEYLIKLLEMEAFRKNNIDTSWLDSLIAEKVVAEKPPTDVAVIIGAVCRAHTHFTEKAESFAECLQRGQLPSIDKSLVSFPIELIYEDVKYSFEISRSDVSALRVKFDSKLRPNDDGRSVLADVRALGDGGKLVLVDGRSHVCYMREEPSGLRASINGKTCLFPREYDPTMLTSSVSGKLIRFLVSNEEQIKAGQAYAELEAMKMYLTLSAPESGKIVLVSTEGSSIEVGDLLARLQLDDPSKVRHSENFQGELPNFAEPQVIGTKPHQQFYSARKEVQLLLQGYDASFDSMDRLMNCFDDARVCAGEIQETLSSLMGRVPSKVVHGIDVELKTMLEDVGVEAGKTNENLSSCFSPRNSSEAALKNRWTKQTNAISLAVRNIIALCHGIPEATELKEVASKYASGSIFVSSISSLLDNYLEIEKHFARQSGSIADVLLILRDRYKNDLSKVFQIASSHICLKEKNSHLLRLLEQLSRPAPAAVLAEDNHQTSEFKAKLLELSQLQASEYADIALRARMMLADLRRPQFQQRKEKVERILREIASLPTVRHDSELQRVVSIRESILDVLLSFILPSPENSNQALVRTLAIKVHVLRSYRAYEVQSIVENPITISSASDCQTAHWKFRFSRREEASVTPMAFASEKLEEKPVRKVLASFDSADDLPSTGAADLIGDEPFRHGLLVTFENWSSMKSNFDNILEAYAAMLNWSSTREVNVLTIMLRWDASAPHSAGKIFHNDNINAHIASESDVSRHLGDFCSADSRRSELATKAGIKAFTFIVAPHLSSESSSYPGFYTFRVKDGFREDTIFRHIDPPMAFQLELSRLSNFNISRFDYPTRTVHVFYAQDKAFCSKARPKRPPSSSPITRFNADTAGNVNNVDCPEIPQSLPQTDARSPGKVSSDHSNNVFEAERDVDARFFVRAVIRHADVYSNSRNGSVVSIPEAERAFIEALDAVEMARCDRRLKRTDFNHIFLNVIPSVNVDIDDVEAICRRMFQRYAKRCWSLCVFAVEIRVCATVALKSDATSTIPLRFLLFNPTGHDLKVESYLESSDPETGLKKILSVSQDHHGSQHGTLLSKPYPVMDRVQRKRVVAQAMDTTYVYDFLQIFNKQLQQLWRRYSEDRLLGGFHRHKIPLTLVESKELILSQPSSKGNTTDVRELVETDRPAGLNSVGVVVWLCVLRTPEYPEGREVVLIANDITFRSGSFGPDEDLLFLLASRYARKRGIPRIFLAANSGARIGIAEEIRDVLQVDWVDPQNPSKGFNHLAIDEGDLPSVSQFIRIGKRLSGNLLEVTDIIGSEHGLGVENLMGSGLIAGETGKAYDEIFTLSYVCSRSVGIGAYLVRLGQRVIQKKLLAPIILTGFSALNKVLGHNVYLSNDQLGGSKVMHPNGITHSVVESDVDGIHAILQWLSYVPKRHGDPLPVIESRDTVHRGITVSPPVDGQPYDPRQKLIGGEYVWAAGQKRFLSGLFDKDSWKEYLDGWAKTVVVGRGRLGGVPTGIVAVETRSIEKRIPADPASPDTHEANVVQAGQVWYPDSSAKTAQAIRDFNREGLPLFILANWRGFSGGMRDMFDEVLKSGSEIVDALRCYNQPIFVYIPPNGEVRGGAWVVLDTLINPAMIEMYADENCRGGVLEPEGTVDVKYRRRHLLKTMHRLDENLRQLDAELNHALAPGSSLSEERKQVIQEAIYARESKILPVYRSVATSFCDLHDTPGRLTEKGAIRRVVKWEEAREFFYWRLRRRLVEERVRQKIRSADPSLSRDETTALLRKWASDYRIEGGANGQVNEFSEASRSEDYEELEKWSFDTDDRWVLQWLEVEEDTVAKRIDKIRIGRLATEVTEIGKESREGFLNGIESVLRSCDNAEQSKLVEAIESKIRLVTSSRSSTSLAASLGILTRLGRLGWERDRPGLSLEENPNKDLNVIGPRNHTSAGPDTKKLSKESWDL